MRSSAALDGAVVASSRQTSRHVLAFGEASDEELAKRSQDAEAFAELYRRYQGAAYRLARRYVATDDRAVDVVASAFEKGYAALSNFDPARGRFAPWILRIAHNCAIDFVRQERRSWRQRSPDSVPLVTEDLNPESVAIGRDEILALRAALTALSTVEQEALALRYGEGLSAAAIATVIGKSVSATEKLLVRAVLKLRREMT